jgi:hypothetical protein
MIIYSGTVLVTEVSERKVKTEEIHEKGGYGHDEQRIQMVRPVEGVFGVV